MCYTKNVISALAMLGHANIATTRDKEKSNALLSFNIFSKKSLVMPKILYMTRKMSSDSQIAVDIHNHFNLLLQLYNERIIIILSLIIRAFLRTLPDLL